LIYQAKGLSAEEASTVAHRIMADPEVALDTMAREELGLDPSELGSPRGAAGASFFAFIGGALVPIAPYLLQAGDLAFSLSAALSAIALLVVGGALASMSGRPVWWGALRMFLAGGAAAAVTYGIGTLVGIPLG
jgi:VIT1/CCC1 family predicted Fe2+/Mn2+ transporter